ncbi:DegT/DnrJ/EryC1/StrS family aminotransferase [Salinibacter grassmerensis]|uniref:DegT/DnrJ/EryC1/StrS family aminotransferase n=1 Tax=Salinibacter grassmerensis TaxID=3040353 RepID=UPI0021E73385|nr:DegT/DnrJ/EryC1/StrS family aminotransferase [Salinibacter grassmerensis]
MSKDTAHSASTLPLARPDVTSHERERVLEVLRSGRLSRGPALEAFETAMADRCGTAYAVAVSSGTAALHCIVSALDLAPGAEVLTTPFSFVASSNVLLYEDLRPRFVDVAPSTYALDVDRVAGALTPRTEAILAVDVFGVPVDWPALATLADAHDLRLIDDACEAIGASVRGRPIGAWGDAASFGFYPNKQVTTGEGGCITTDDADLARRCRALRNQGRSQQSSGRMRHDRLGYNYRLDEMSAALGCAQLDRLDTLLDRRAAVAAMYEEALAPLADGVARPEPTDDAERSWFVYVVRLRDDFAPGARDQLMDRLQARGIGCAPYFPPIHLQPHYRDRFGFAPGDFPVCESVSARTLALPFFGDMTRADVDRVAEALTKILPTLPRQP